MTGCCQVTTSLPDQAVAEISRRHWRGAARACAQVWAGLEHLSLKGEWSTPRMDCQVKTTFERLPASQKRIRDCIL